jgi:hypothetical protein
LDEFEAMDLRSYMLITCAASRIGLYQLGNKEWCLRTLHDGGPWFIWDMRDARAFLQALETRSECGAAKQRATRSARSRERERVTV